MSIIRRLWISAALSLAVCLSPVSAVAEDEIDQVERRIQFAQKILENCKNFADLLNQAQNPPPLYQKKLKEMEDCIAKFEAEIKWLKKKLKDLLSKLPNADLPREDPESRKLREKLGEWQKKVDEGEKQKDELKADLAKKKKERKR